MAHNLSHTAILCSLFLSLQQALQETVYSATMWDEQIARNDVIASSTIIIPISELEHLKTSEGTSQD